LADGNIMNEDAYLIGFVKRAQQRGLDERQTATLLKQAGLGSWLPKLGLMGLGGLGLYGAQSGLEAIEDAQMSEHQEALERLLETSKAMPSDKADAYISRYLKNIMKQRHRQAEDIYNL
jgi:hypothetical protein